MPIGPTTNFGKERVFVDREACIQAFRENIQKSGTPEYNVLFFHGIAGIGKSKLQKELQKILKEEYPKILWVSVDLNTKTYREVGTFLITLRNKIQEKSNAKFYIFNIAHAIYWKKLHPEVPLIINNYPLIKEGGFFSKIIDILNEFGPARLTFDIINNAPDNVKRFFKEQAVDIDKLTAMEAYELEKFLPGFFAADFSSYLGMNSKAYIFIDTYETLWEGMNNKGSFHEKDEWIRDDLIPNMFGVSWVICGREKILWAECDPDWKMYLEQHSVDELPENYCAVFLEECGIENKSIRDIIIKASEGVPYHLNLSVDTFEKISRSRLPISEDFGKTQPEIFTIFVKYLDSNEIRALEVLSAPNFWDRDMFEILMEKFDPGLPIGAFSELIEFSFIKKNVDEKCFIHQLMRKSLQEHQNLIDRKNVHRFMFDYYNSNLEEINIKAIVPEQETALVESFYHAKEILEAEELFKWFINVSNPFNEAAFWQLIIPLYEEMLRFLKTKLGTEHLFVSTTLSILAHLYDNMGYYEKALPLFKRALDIREKVLEPENSDIATLLNNLALTYRQIGNFEQALPLYQRALDISEKVMGLQHPSVATTLNNLAGLYKIMGYCEKAFLLCQRALNIYESVLDPQDIEVARTLNNLAELYHHMGHYSEAIPLYQRALGIHENVLGEQHPDAARILNNYAELYRMLGYYEKALPLYQRALGIYENVLGQQHPFVAVTLNNLALLNHDQGYYEKALPLYQRALETSEKILGHKHLEVATILDNLAGLYDDKGDYAKALPLYQRALDIRESVLEPEHPYVVATRKNLAALYQKIGYHGNAQ